MLIELNAGKWKKLFPMVSPLFWRFMLDWGIDRSNSRESVNPKIVCFESSNELKIDSLLLRLFLYIYLDSENFLLNSWDFLECSYFNSWSMNSLNYGIDDFYFICFYLLRFNVFEPFKVWGDMRFVRSIPIDSLFNYRWVIIGESYFFSSSFFN